MKIDVNHETCIGCGMCISVDSENFDYDSEGYATAINNNVTNKTVEAQESCPVDAITINDKK